ncbi:MAG: hypothetical protein QNL70_07665, partial [Pseudomonas sp.]
RGKSTRQSHGTPIFYVDLILRSGISTEEALQQAQQLDQARREAGFDQQALDAAAHTGLNNGAFEDSEDEAHQVLEEFYPDSGTIANPSISTPRTRKNTPTLHELILERSHPMQQHDVAANVDISPGVNQ